MSYRIAGIDVHKRMLAVVLSDVEVDGEYQFERRMFGSNPEQLRSLAAWLVEQEAEEVVMESTAQYWKPVWETLERYWKPLREKRESARRRSGTLHLAQAQSNRGRRGRKRDFADAERLLKRLVARELTLSFVPDAEQRLWRTVTRKKYQLRRERVRLHNQLESLLEEAHIKLSSLVSDLLGASALRMLKALADGETNPAALATVDTGSGVKNGKLKGKDFFDVEKNPLITFHSSKAVQTGPDTIEFDGDFTIRGVTKQEKLLFKVTGKGNGSGTIKGTMAFDRKQYGMNSGIPFIKIAERVEVSVDLKGERISGPPVNMK